MNRFSLPALFLMAHLTTASPGQTVDSAGQKPMRSAQSQTRLAPAPTILPGAYLDTSMNSLPAQDSSVGKAAPAWLRAQTTGSPMYIINGKSASATQLRQLKRQEVLSVQSMPGNRAAGLYGKNARRGLVIITTRSGVSRSGETRSGETRP